MKDMNKPTHQNSAQNTAPIMMEQLPSMPALLGKVALKSGHYQVGDPLPRLSTKISALHINPAHLQSYRALCGFEQSEKLPATYLHMLAFPLFLNILIQQDFPMKAMGQVHLRNKISVLEQFDLRQAINMTAGISRSKLTSKGLEWDIDVRAHVDNQLVWSSESPFLHRCKTDIKRSQLLVVKKYGKPQLWSVAADTGRRYARISGDYNPIHLTDITAKLFGFKQAIAHGMWSKARCLAAMDQQLPAAGYSVDVDFNRPLFLPSQVQFYSGQRQGQQRFSLFNQEGDQAHLEGFIS